MGVDEPRDIFCICHLAGGGHPPASSGQLSTARRPEGQWDRATRLPCLSSFKDQNRDVDP